MKITRIYLCFILPIALLISNCGTLDKTEIVSVSSPIASVTQFIENLAPPETSPTPSVASPTATLYPGEVEYHCINISDDMSQFGNLSGTLVLNGFLDPSAPVKPSLLLDLHVGSEIPFEIDYLTHRIVASPNGDYLAYDLALEPDFRNNQINIINSKGEMVTKALEQEVINIEWLNDETLLVNSQLELYENHPLIFLSPFDDTQKIVQPFATQKERIALFDSDLLRQWGFYSAHKIIYNSSLTRAIYAAQDQNGGLIIFRDLTSNQDISTLITKAWGISPKWSPDGTKMAIGVNVDSVAGKNELAIFDQNGEKLFVTRLSMRLGEYAYISSLSWSPDGDQIAFWYTTHEDINSNLRLAVFDTRTQKTTDYCVTSNGVAHIWHRNDTSPIWSPDGNFLLIETTNSDNNDPKVVIVDLVQEYANIIKTGYEPIGWMK